MFEQLKEIARKVGRDFQSLELVVRANLGFKASTVPKERADFTGSLDQINTDFEATKKLGASELVCDVQLDDILKRMEQLLTIAKQS